MSPLSAVVEPEFQYEASPAACDLAKEVPDHTAIIYTLDRWINNNGARIRFDLARRNR
jgi:hypothetical protein